MAHYHCTLIEHVLMWPPTKQTLLLVKFRWWVTEVSAETRTPFSHVVLNVIKVGSVFNSLSLSLSVVSFPFMYDLLWRQCLSCLVHSLVFTGLAQYLRNSEGEIPECFAQWTFWLDKLSVVSEKFEINFEEDTDSECMTKYPQIIIGYPEGYIIMQ